MGERWSMTDEVLASSGSDSDYSTAASDFYFVIDCTQTMQWVLDTICENLKRLVEIFDEAKLRMRYGVLEFRDNKVQNEPMVQHLFQDSHFTEKIEKFEKILLSLSASGGGPPKESVFDALKLAVEEPDWRQDATRIVVLFTDAEPHKPDVNVKSWEECIEIIESSGIDMLHMVVSKEHIKKYQTLKLIQGSDGNDLPGELLSLGDSKQSGEKLVKVLEGIGYSSKRQASIKRAKQGFRGL